MEDQDANETAEAPNYAAILAKNIWNNMTPIKIWVGYSSIAAIKTIDKA